MFNLFVNISHFLGLASDALEKQQQQQQLQLEEVKVE